MVEFYQYEYNQLTAYVCVYAALINMHHVHAGNKICQDLGVYMLYFLKQAPLSVYFVWWLSGYKHSMTLMFIVLCPISTNNASYVILLYAFDDK